MFSVHDLNPLCRSPPFLTDNSNQDYLQLNGLSPMPQQNTTGSDAFLGQNTSIPDSNNLDRDSATITNYYKFANITDVVCCFYHVFTDSSNLQLQTVPTLLQRVHGYDLLLKSKLLSEHGIKNIVTYVSKREICIYQIRTTKKEDGSTTIPDMQQAEGSKSNDHPEIRYLKNAIDQIVVKHHLNLKFLSSSVFDSEIIFQNSASTSQTPKKRPIGIVYLSFLRAVKCYIIHQLSSWHRLFQGSKHALSLDMVPFGNQMLTTSTIHTTIASGPSGPERKKSLGSYSILQVNPSMNKSSDLLVNFSASKKMFYKLSDYLTIHCSNDPSLLDKMDFAVYMCPSGVQCSFAVEGSFSKSICDEPSSIGSFASLLKAYSNIDIIKDISIQPNEARKWIRLVPNLGHVNGLTQDISRFTEQVSSAGRFIMWPLELCFILFPMESKASSSFDIPSICDPWNLTDKLLNICQKNGGKPKMDVRSARRESRVKKNMRDDIAARTTSSVKSITKPSEPRSPVKISAAPEGSADNMQSPSETESRNNLPSVVFNQQNKNDDDDPPLNNNKNVNMDGDDDNGNDENMSDLFGDDDSDDLKDTELANDEELMQKKSNKNCDNTDEANDEVDKHTDTSSIHLLSARTSPLYEDPGAPRPISMQIFATPSTSESIPESEDNSTGSKSSGEFQKSVFAPLSFNPQIRKDIDSKYSSGGKYFVKSSENSTQGTTSEKTKPKFPVGTEADVECSDSEDDKSGSSNEDSEDTGFSSSNEVAEDSEDEIEDKDHDENGSKGESDAVSSAGSDEESEASEVEEDSYQTSTSIHNMDTKQSVGVQASSLLSSPVTPHSAIFEKSGKEMESWMFWILRGPSVVSIPPHFLPSTNTLKVSKGELETILPVLEDFILFSQKDLRSADLSSLIQHRSTPSMPDFDVDFVLQKVFPGVRKTPLVDLLKEPEDATNDPKLKSETAYECLFGENPPYEKKESPSKIFEHSDNHEFDDPSFSTATPSEQQHSQQLSPNFLPSIEPGTKESEVVSNKLFRIPSTFVSVKRLGKKLKLNETALLFWKQLGLDIARHKKNFEILVVMPQSDNGYYVHEVNQLIDSLVQEYSTRGLGTILKCRGSGMVTIRSEKSTEESYWSQVQKVLLGMIPSLKEDISLQQLKEGKDVHPRNLLLLFATPYNNVSSLIRMGHICATFKLALSTEAKSEHESEDQKRRKVSSQERYRPAIPNIFYKVVSFTTFYSNAQLRYDFQSLDYMGQLAFQLYSICPESTIFEEKSSFFNIAQPFKAHLDFEMTKSSVAEDLVNDDFCLHVCYERSIDKRWCVVSWTDQYGDFNYLKSWYISEDSAYKSFSSVAESVFSISLQFMERYGHKGSIILARLNDILPDDELSAWKKISLQHRDIKLVVLTVETESSSLILSNYRLPSALKSKRCVNPQNMSDLQKGSTLSSGLGIISSASLTPNIEVNSVVSPSFGTSSNIALASTAGTNSRLTPGSRQGLDSAPSYDLSSPMDYSQVHSLKSQLGLVDSSLSAAGTPNVDASTSVEVTGGSGSLFDDPVLIDRQGECYGIIFPTSQPLAHQQIRLPLQTGFLIGTGNGVAKNKTLEVNLLSCPSNVDSVGLLKKLLIQYKCLSVFSIYYCLFPAVRLCGNVESGDSGVLNNSIDIRNENYSSPERRDLDSSEFNTGVDAKKAAGKNIRYHEFCKLQKQQQKLCLSKVSADRFLYDEHPVIPPHITAVREMLDFLVHIKIE